MEALLLLLNLLAFTHLCWLAVRFERSDPKRPKSLGIFAYREDRES